CAGDEHMETNIYLEETEHRVRLQFCPHSIQGFKLSLEVLVAQARSSQADSQHFQSATQLVDFVNILGSEGAGPETAPGIRTDQPLMNKPLQGLAHWSTAHSQLLSQRDIREPLLFTSTEHDDPLPQLFIRIIHHRRHSTALLPPE